VAFFREKVNNYYMYSYTWTNTGGGGGTATNGTLASAILNNNSSNSSFNCSVNCSSPMQSPKNDLGTGWGENKRSDVINVSFERASVDPECIFSIKYATRDSLKDAGVDLDVRPAYIQLNPFPNSPEYCKEPTIKKV
jgi:hypothetical protein